jgi:hypothetical protein
MHLLHYSHRTMNFIFIESYLSKHFSQNIVVELVGGSLPLASDEDSGLTGNCGAWASMPKEKFREKFEAIRLGWRHPVCQVIDNLTGNASFWNRSPGFLVKGSYQMTLVNHIIKGTLNSIECEQQL